MGLYDAFKDVISVAQKADNIELYRQLLDLRAQALDLQENLAKAKAENAELKKKKDLANEIVRHEEPCITLKSDGQKLYYCSHCWDSQQLLIQISCHPDGTFDCPHCKAKGNYDNALKRQSDANTWKMIGEINRRPRGTLF